MTGENDDMELELTTTKMLTNIDSGIGWVTFNQPEKRNAINLEMAQALGDILEHFQGNDEVRVVVMRGAGGKSFVAGADISEFKEKRANTEQRAEYARISERGYGWLKKLDKPLVALIEGYCIGGGLATALSADVRFATPDSTFGIPAAKLGLGYAFDGIAVLADLVGPSTARDILFSARFLDASEALSKGLVNFVIERDEIETSVREYAQKIATNAPLTIKAAKAALAEYVKAPHERDLERIKELVNTCFDSDDYKEGVKAFGEKRKPEFRGR